MPQNGDRRGQVLHWNEVYGQFARAAASMPVEAVDRDLAAMGYDLDTLSAAIGRLGRRTVAQAAAGTSVACREERADAMPPPFPQPAPHVVANARGRARHHGGWRRGARRAVAGVVAVALLAWLAVPISETGHLPTAAIAKSDKQAHIRVAEANAPGVAEERDANSGSPHIANPPYAKAATPEKCEGAYVQTKAVAAGDKLAGIVADEKLIADDGEDNGAHARAEDAERPRLTAMARGQQPASVG